MSDEVFSMTIIDSEGPPFLRRLHPTSVFEYKGERWAVAEAWEGWWCTHVATGFAATGFFYSEEEAIADCKRILDQVEPGRYALKMSEAVKARKEAEKRGFIEEMENV